MTTLLSVRWGAKHRGPRCRSSSRWVIHWCMGRSTVLKNQKQRRTAQTWSSYIPRKTSLWDKSKTHDWIWNANLNPLILHLFCLIHSFLIGSKIDADRWVTMLSFVEKLIPSDTQLSGICCWRTWCEFCCICFLDFLLSTKECMREMWSVRSRCPITQATWDRGLPPPAKMR